MLIYAALQILLYLWSSKIKIDEMCGENTYLSVMHRPVRHTLTPVIVEARKKKGVQYISECYGLVLKLIFI